MKLLGLELRWPWSKQQRTCSYLPPYDAEVLPGPHCDPYVLHLDGCTACEDYVEAKAERIHRAINFTGSYLPSRAPCPAEARRPLEQIYAWPGNRPHLEETPS